MTKLKKQTIMFLSVCQYNAHLDRIGWMFLLKYPETDKTPHTWQSVCRRVKHTFSTVHYSWNYKEMHEALQSVGKSLIVVYLNWVIKQRDVCSHLSQRGTYYPSRSSKNFPVHLQMDPTGQCVCCTQIHSRCDSLHLCAS